MEVESVNSKTEGIDDDDGSCKSKSGVKVKRYHDGQFSEPFPVANRDKVRASEDLYYRDEDEYDTDRGALWQPRRRCRDGLETQ